MPRTSMSYGYVASTVMSAPGAHAVATAVTPSFAGLSPGAAARVAATVSAIGLTAVRLTAPLRAPTRVASVRVM